MGELTTSFVVAIAASIAGIVLFELAQYTVFTEVVRNATLGQYTVRNLHLEVKEITDEHVSIFVKEDEATCDLKEMESCYSGCSQITVLDIKKGEADIQVREDIVCRMKIATDQLRSTLPVAKFLLK